MWVPNVSELVFLLSRRNVHGQLKKIQFPSLAGSTAFFIFDPHMSQEGGTGGHQLPCWNPAAGFVEHAVSFSSRDCPARNDCLGGIPTQYGEGRIC